MYHIIHHSSTSYSPHINPELITKEIEMSSEALHSAIRDSRYTEAMMLISRMSQDLIKAADRYGQTALHLSANVDDPQMSANLCHNLCSKMDENAICHQTSEGQQTALHFAAREHNLDFVIELKKNLSMNCLKKMAGMTDNHEQTPLHYAVEEGCFKMSKLLHEIDSTVVLKQDKNGQTALHLAALVKSKDIVELLVDTQEKKILVEKFDSRQRTALYFAAYVGSFEISSLLYNIMKDSADEECSVFMRPNCGHTVLHAAVHAKSMKIVKLLTKDDKIMRALVSVIDKFGQTTLHCAAHEGFVEISSHLYTMMKTFDQNLIFKQNKNKQTALHLATYSNSLKIVNLLTEDPEIKDKLLGIADEYGQTALHWAVNFEASDISARLFELMKSNKSFLLRTNQGEYTALHLAVKAKKRNIVKKLLAEDSLEAKELAGQKDVYGQTALHWAAGYGDFEMSSDLYKVMKDQDSLLAKTKHNEYTALHLAVQARSKNVVNEDVVKIVKLLTQDSKRGKDLADQVDKYNQTALHWAAFDGCVEICQVLFDRMSPEKIKAQTENKGQTAMHFAVQAGHEAIVDLLTKNNDIVKELIALCDKQGLTALDLAKKEKYLGIQAILKSFDENISKQQIS